MNINFKGWWYSPTYVISMVSKLVTKYGQKVLDKDQHNFKQVGEMRGAAIMLLGLRKALNIHFFMQAANAKDEFPDVWTIYQEEIPGSNVETKFQTVEVVTYEKHTSDSVGDFILKSKLINPKKAYDEDTIILCYIRKDRTRVNFTEIHEKLAKAIFKPTNVYIIGNLAGGEDIFVLSQVWPNVSHLKFNYIDESKKYPPPHRRTYTRGVSKTLKSEKKGRRPINPYEVFNIDELKVKMKYGK